MNQIIAVVVAFSFIPVLLKLRFKLSYALLTSTAIMAALSGLKFAVLMQAVMSIVTLPDSLNTLLTIMMVIILGELMKHYGIINEIINTMSFIIRDRRKILAITPALMGVLIMPGGALLSAPFVYELGNEMNLKPPRSAAVNLVFRHLAMFIFPYSSSILVVQAAMPELNISKLVLLNMAFVIAIIVLGNLFFLRDIEATKSPPPKNLKRNILKLIIYTSPIYVCIIINLITGLPFYITLFGSVFTVYLLGYKKDFLNVIFGTFNKGNFMTLLTVSSILIMKEIVLSMDGLFSILQNVIGASQNNILSIMLFFLASSFVLGYITGLNNTPLAIMLPFISEFNISGGLVYVIAYFVFGVSFLGYYFSPLHLCQAFTVEHMKVSTGELYKEYRFYAPLLLLFLIVSTLIFRLVIG